MNGDLARYDDGGEQPRFDVVPYLEAPLRRPWLVLGALAATTALAVGVSFLLPKRYQTSTLILVESQKVPESVLREEVEGRGPRLQTIRQEILGRTRLEHVIRELDPYPDRAGAPATEVVDAMRSAIEISVKGNDAFSIDYTHRDPVKAQQVANRLATLFIEETSQTREDQAAGATEFLDSQLQDARRELEAKELAIRRYKEARMGRLPEQTTANLATLQRLQIEDQTVAEGLRAARTRLRELEAGQPAPRPAADGRPSAGPDAATELAQMKAQLAALRARYTDEHPDVRSLRDRIAQQERQAVDTTPGSGGADLRRAEIEEARRDLAELEAKKAQVEGRMFSFQNRVEDTPRTEQELATLTRDYQKINENYLELLKKKMDAQMTQRLEQRWKGEQFRVLDPAFLPERPIFPKRSLFLIGGLSGGIVIGLALALLLEFLQPGVRSLRQLEGRLPYPVLASFPRMGAPPGLATRLVRRLMPGGTPAAASRAGGRR
jgi:polysaccharide chain length determinant protein (PEP-CTERM system associated)